MFFKKKPKEKDEDLAVDYDLALSIAIATLQRISNTPTASKSNVRGWAVKAITDILEVRNK